MPAACFTSASEACAKLSLLSPGTHLQQIALKQGHWISKLLAGSVATQGSCYDRLFFFWEIDLAALQPESAVLIRNSLHNMVGTALLKLSTAVWDKVGAPKGKGKNHTKMEPFLTGAAKPPRQKIAAWVNFPPPPVKHK